MPDISDCRGVNQLDKNVTKDGNKMEETTVAGLYQRGHRALCHCSTVRKLKELVVVAQAEEMQRPLQ